MTPRRKKTPVAEAVTPPAAIEAPEPKVARFRCACGARLEFTGPTIPDHTAPPAFKSQAHGRRATCPRSGKDVAPFLGGRRT